MALLLHTGSMLNLQWERQLSNVSLKDLEAKFSAIQSMASRADNLGTAGMRTELAKIDALAREAISLINNEPSFQQAHKRSKVALDPKYAEADGQLAEHLLFNINWTQREEVYKSLVDEYRLRIGIVNDTIRVHTDELPEYWAEEIRFHDTVELATRYAVVRMVTTILNRRKHG